MSVNDKRSPSEVIRILIVEDEPITIEFLLTGLRYEGFEADVASDGHSGLEKALHGGYDLVILDVMLPELDGFGLCKRLRSTGCKVPVIMLTAKQDVSDRVEGLDSGADDYITKPFSFAELLARIRAIVRRMGHAAEPPVLRAADITLDLEAHEAYKGNRLIHLTPTEFSLLELFMRHPRQVLTRETLLNRVWGYDYFGNTGVVDVHISHLRSKLGDSPPYLIQTVYGLGYIFRPEEGDK